MAEPAGPVLGLHHVTATVGDAQEDLDFCVDTLGLRLVKKTVNFDNHHVYHFYYGNERGTPGTIWTTFPYKGRGVPVGRKGAGQIGVTAFSVPAGSLSYWRERLTARGIRVEDVAPRFGEEAIRCADRSGLLFELVATDRDDRAPWTGGGVRPDAAIRGLHHVTMTVRTPQGTLDLVSRLLGYAVVDEAEGRVRIGVAGGGPGRIVDIVHSTEAPPGLNGLGTVHHVAMSVAHQEEQKRVRAELLQYGCTVTEVRDRCYFTSIYFREPGGVLFEVATVGPGFAIDEEPTHLGAALKLPSWEEPYRAEIERELAPVVHR
jgi:glyoxalase family protein